MNKALSLSKIAIIALVITTACYPGDDLVVSDLDIVATNYDDEYFNRNSPRTYFMPDTVGVIGDGDANDYELTRAEMDFILAQVASNFSALNYERIETVDDNNLPDVVVTVNTLVTDVTGGGCIPWWPWWGWYPWYPGWGWGPGYCYPAYVYSYTSGTLTMDMIAPATSTDQDFDIVWRAGINGLVRSNTSGNQTFVRETIDQAFDQSPYLQP